MATLETEIASNDFGNMQISPLDTSNYDSLDRFAYADEASKPSSVVDLSGAYSMLQDTNVYLSLQYLLNWHDDEEVESQTFKEHADNFRKNVYWLTGNENSGGIFFFRVGNDLNPGVYYELLEKEDQGTHYIRFYIGFANTLGANTPYELSEVAIFFADSVDENYPSFYFMTKKTTDSDWMIEYFRPGDLQDTGKSTDSLAEAIQDPSYSVSTPNQTWANYMVNWVFMPTIPPQDADTGSGSWSGGSAIDPSYNPYPDASDPAYQDEPDRPEPDTIDVDDPNESGIDACNSGFITLYNPTKQSVIDFNNYLFTDITDSISQQLKRLFSNPLEYIVFIAMCHFKPTTSIAQHNIVFAGIDSGVSAPIVGQQFKVIDCGSLKIPMQNSNFTDFAPYSKVCIYLPYIGFRDLKIDEVRGATLYVSYSVDLMTGSCVCYVRAVRGQRGFWSTMSSKDCELNSIILTAEGNCFELLPLSAVDFRNFYNGLIGIVGGGMAAAAGNFAGGMGAMASSVASMKPNVNRSGNGTGNYGYFGNQTPFVIITYPYGANPGGFGEYEGFPSNMIMEIKKCYSKKPGEGYVEIDPDTIWMNDIPCLDAEMDEIKDLLNKGVFVNVQ